MKIDYAIAVVKWREVWEIVSCSIAESRTAPEIAQESISDDGRSREGPARRQSSAILGQSKVAHEFTFGD